MDGDETPRSGAEIILRVCASLGALLIFIAHALIIGALRTADCPADAEERVRGTLLFAALSGAGCLLMPLGLRWRDALRWFAAFALVLVAFGLWTVVPMVAATSVSGAPLCTVPGAQPAAVSGLERAWPAVQAAVLLFGAYQSARFWRP